MKNIFYTIIFLSSINIFGQPMIGSDAIVTIGEVEPTIFINIDEQNWQSGSSGQNQVWDFSSLDIEEECEYIALDPAESPYFDSFPDSDIYFICSFSDSQGQITENHTFYNQVGDILQLSGNVSISISNPSFDSIFIVYKDPLDWGTFPYAFEDTSEDIFEARITSYLGAQVIVAIQSGTSTQEVDGYGTLTTPSGTFENTIRVKRTEFAQNSIPGIPFSSPQESYRYTWYGENENGVLLNLDRIVVKDFNDNVLTTTFAGSYRVAGPTTTSTSTIYDVDLSIFPNPIMNEIDVELKNLSNYKLYIYTIDGQSLPYSIESLNDNSSKLKLLRDGITSGTYFIHFVDKVNNVKFSKTIILQ